MDRGTALANAVIVLGAVLAVGAQGDKKRPTVKEVMKRAHAGPSSLLTTAGRILKADSPDWTDLSKRTKELAELGDALGKNEPPTGDKAAWEKATKAYLEQVKALDAAADKRDAAAGRAAKAKIDTSCTACHKAHRKQDDE